jgi:hypothetical protein
MTNKPATFRTGQCVKLAYCGRTIDAEVMLASPNGVSLMLRFDGALPTPDGGMFVGQIPLLRDGHGVYRDLMANAIATLSAN